MGLWPSFLPSGTRADSNGMLLLFSTKAMLEGFVGVFRGCYVVRHHGRNVGIGMNVCIPREED